MQRSFLGEIRTLRPCAACRGFGQIIPDPCRECSGEGRVRSRRSLTVKIPAGVDHGTRVQLSEQGEVGPGGGPPGDLYVEIHVDAHPTFTRHGNDLHCTVTLPMTAAALGTTLTLPLLEADLETSDDSDVRTDYELEIKPGTQSGSEQVLRGFGVPGLRGGRGDLIVDGRRRHPDPPRPPSGGAAARAGGDPRRGVAGRGGPRTPQVDVRPPARRLQPALIRQDDRMSLPVHLVPSLDGVAVGADGRGDRRRGPPRGRRTSPARRRAGGADRRRGSLGDRRGHLHRQAGLHRDGRLGRLRRTGRRRPSPWSRRCPRATAASSPSRCSPRWASTWSSRGRPSRSVAVWKGERAAKSHAKWQATAREAGKQSRRSWLPTVSPLASTDAVARPGGRGRPGRGAPRGRDDAARRAWTCRPPGGSSWSSGPRAASPPTSWRPWRPPGPVTVRLGDEVLRTSTAGVVAVAALLSRTDRWR